MELEQRRLGFMRMVRAPFAFGLSMLLAGCGSGTGDGESDRAADAVTEPAPKSVAANAPSQEVSGTIGPIRFSYDSAKLTLAELPIDLPPRHDSEAWAVKLIPVERAKRLGQERCRYGSSGREQVCTAEKESGLILAFLERPLDEYRTTFEEERLGDELEPAELDGAQGFAFTAEAEGSGIEYRFLPVDDRTLLVARQFNPAQAARSDAMRDVIRSVAQDLRSDTPDG